MENYGPPLGPTSSSATVVETTPYAGTGFAPLPAYVEEPDLFTAIGRSVGRLFSAMGLGAVADPDDAAWADVGKRSAAAYAAARGADSSWHVKTYSLPTYGATPNQVAAILARGQASLDRAAQAFDRVGSGGSLNIGKGMLQLPQTPIDWGGGAKKKSGGISKVVILAVVVGGGYMAAKKLKWIK